MENKKHPVDVVLDNLILMCFTGNYLQIAVQFPNSFYKWWTIFLGVWIIANAAYEIWKERKRG